MGVMGWTGRGEMSGEDGMGPIAEKSVGGCEDVRAEDGLEAKPKSGSPASTKAPQGLRTARESPDCARCKRNEKKGRS